MEYYDLSTIALVLENNTEAFVKKCEEAKVTDEQWFIDWEIKMSKLVTQDHYAAKNN